MINKDVTLLQVAPLSFYGCVLHTFIPLLLLYFKKYLPAMAPNGRYLYTYIYTNILVYYCALYLQMKYHFILRQFKVKPNL